MSAEPTIEERLDNMCVRAERAEAAKDRAYMAGILFERARIVAGITSEALARDTPPDHWIFVVLRHVSDGRQWVAR